MIELTFASVLERWPLLLQGMMVTILLTTSMIAISLPLGVLMAVVARSAPRPLAKLVTLYVELIRNTPLLVQLFLAYFGLAALGWRIDAFPIAVTTLALHMAAYTTEIVRAGMDAVPRAQVEAAQCLGLSGAQIYLYVMIIPALAAVFPALSGMYVLGMLATSLTSQITVRELTAAANSIQAITYRSFEAYIVVATLYLCLAGLTKGTFGLIGRLILPRPLRTSWRAA